MTGLGAFLVFGITMGLLVFLLTFLGATAGVGLARSLRVWGRRIQLWAALVIILIGAALVYSGINPGVFDRLILTS